MSRSATRRLMIAVAAAAAMFLALFASVRARRHAALQAERESRAAADAMLAERDRSRATPAEGSPRLADESVPNQTAREQVASAGDEVLFEVRVICADDRQPMAGAWVACDDIQAETNPNGVAAILARDAEDYRGLWESGDLQIDVLAERCIPRSVTVPASATRVDIWMLRGVALSGVVVDALDKKPIAGAEVWVEQDWSGDAGVREWQESNADGEFEPIWVRAGMPIEVVIETLGYASHVEELSLVIDERHTFELGRGGVVRGIVRDPDGQPAKRAEVKLFGARAGTDPVAGAETDSEGRFEVRGLAVPGAYYLWCSRDHGWLDVNGVEIPLYAATVPFLLEGLDAARFVEVILSPQTCRIDVTIVDERGSALAGVNVRSEYLRSRERPGVLRRGPSRSSSAETDANGRCVLLLNGPGMHDVLASPYGRPHAAARVEVVPGVAARATLVVGRGGRLGGTVRTTAGEAVEGVRVSASQAIGSSYPSVFTHTDRLGRFLFKALDSGTPATVAVQPICAGGTRTGFDQRFGPFDVGREDLELALAPTTAIVGRIEPRPRVLPLRGAAIPERGHAEFELEVDAMGAFELCVGGFETRFSIAIQIDEAPPMLLGPFAPRGGERIDVGTLSLPTHVLAGTVFGPDEAPASGANLQVDFDRWSWDRAIAADEGGAYRIEGLPNASGSISAVAPGCLESYVQLADLGAVRELDFRLVRAPRIVGRVRSESRERVRGATACAAVSQDDTPYWSNSCATTEEDGTYELELEPGRYALFLYPFGSDEPIRGPEVEIVDQDVTVDWDV